MNLRPVGRRGNQLKDLPNANEKIIFCDISLDVSPINPFVVEIYAV